MLTNIGKNMKIKIEFLIWIEINKSQLNLPRENHQYLFCEKSTWQKRSEKSILDLRVNLTSARSFQANSQEQFLVCFISILKVYFLVIGGRPKATLVLRVCRARGFNYVKSGQRFIYCRARHDINYIPKYPAPIVAGGKSGGPAQSGVWVF